jgi:putative transposase
LNLTKVGDFWTAAFPTQIGQVRVPLALAERQVAILEGIGKDVQQGAAKLYCKRQRWYLALSVTVPSAPCAGTKVAGVDLGLRNLAVVGCEGATLFFNGDHAAYVRRRMSNLRRRMGKAKALQAIQQMKDKEARWMKNHDHQISRAIVDWCIARGVATIRMEDLQGIRLRRKRDRKDRGRSLHAWSFHRLQQYIAYKASLSGIKVELVVPTNTSRACPACGVIDKANRSGIRYLCKSCGHQEHADSVGARNVSKAISGLAVA